MIDNQIQAILDEVAKLHHRNELSKIDDPTYFEPGMMEYLDKYDGSYMEDSQIVLLRFAVKGTAYEGRTELIEKIENGDPINVIRDLDNEHNSNLFVFTNKKGENVGYMPTGLCNAIAPLYDAGKLTFDYAKVSFVDPLSKRNRHARKAVLFLECKCKILI